MCRGEALLLSPIRVARPGRLGSRRRRLPHAVAFVPVNSIDGSKGIGLASMRVEDQAQVAASVDPDDLEALSLVWRVGLRLGRAGWRTFDDARLWSHRAHRRRSIFGAGGRLRDLGCRLRCRSSRSSMATRILGPWRGRSVCVLKQEVLENQGPGSPCACRHTTPSDRRHKAPAPPCCESTARGSHNHTRRGSQGVASNGTSAGRSPAGPLTRRSPLRRARCAP